MGAYFVEKFVSAKVFFLELVKKKELVRTKELFSTKNITEILLFSN
jgi:hypothetical protein